MNFIKKLRVRLHLVNQPYLKDFTPLISELAKQHRCKFKWIGKRKQYFVFSPLTNNASRFRLAQYDIVWRYMEGGAA